MLTAPPFTAVNGDDEHLHDLESAPLLSSSYVLQLILSGCYQKPELYLLQPGDQLLAEVKPLHSVLSECAGSLW